MLGISNDAQCSKSDFWIPEFFFVRFLVFEIWSIFYFTLVMHSVLNRLEKKCCCGGWTWVTHAFGLRALALLVSVNGIFCKNQIFRKYPIQITTVEYKIDHISKTKNRTKKLTNTKIRFRTLRIFWAANFFSWVG